MTRFIDRELTCKACGARSSYRVLGSTNSFGYPDLDLRPAGMARGADLGALLQCKDCGYCAPDISKGPDGVEDIINSEPYRRAIADSAGPDLAGRWRRWALVSEAAGDRATAGWANLRAAWASEDARQEDAAGTYRAIALEHLSGCAETGVRICENAESQQLLLLDLYRRLGRYAEAMGIADVVAASTTTDEVRDIARFQAVLSKREDRRRYSVGSAKNYAAPPRKWFRRIAKKATRQWLQFWR